MMPLNSNKRRGLRKNARRRLLHFECCEERLLLTSYFGDRDPATDLAALFAEPTDSIAMRVRIETSDAAGVPISEAHVGDEFLVNVYVQDTREAALGVYATYLNLLYNPDLVSAGNVVQFGDSFAHGRSISATVPGVIGEVGGFSGSFTGSGSSELLLMSMPFVATRPGQVDFVGEAPDYANSIPLVFGHNSGVPFNEVDFGRATIKVVASEPPTLQPLSTNVNVASINTTSAFRPIESFGNATYGSKLSRDYDPARFFAPTQAKVATTQATSQMPANGGFNDLDALLIQGSDESARVTYSLDREIIAGQLQQNIIGTFDPVEVDAYDFTGSGARLIAFNSVRRVGDDAVAIFGQTGTPNEIRAFTSAELPSEGYVKLQTQRSTRFEEQDDSGVHVARADGAASISRTSDDSVRDTDTEVVVFNVPAENGGYINLAGLGQVALPNSVDVPNIRAIHIARADTQPTSDATTKLADGSRTIALASLTWQLQVDGSRGVSLAFEMAEESHEGRAAQPNQIRRAIPIPQSNSGLAVPPHEDSPVPDTPVMPPNSKTVSHHPGHKSEHVRDEHRHYLAVSPLIVIAAGALLVTEGWQKLQPREEKPKLR